MKKIVALDDPRWNWRKATNDRKSLSPDEAEVLWRSLEHAILTIKTAGRWGEKITGTNSGDTQESVSKALGVSDRYIRRGIQRSGAEDRTAVAHP